MVHLFVRFSWVFLLSQPQLAQIGTQHSAPPEQDLRLASRSAAVSGHAFRPIPSPTWDFCAKDSADRRRL